MALGGCVDHRGCVLLYTSPDMKVWHFQHIILQSDQADDIPFECPNLCFVDGHAVLIWSPCAAVQYAVGDFDHDLHFHVSWTDVLDPSGRDGFYAPQILHDRADVCILFGWMPETDGDAAAERKGWSGLISLPRQLYVHEGKLLANPFSGWEALCEQPVAIDKGSVRDAGERFILKASFDQDFAVEEKQLGFALTCHGDEVTLALPDGKKHIRKISKYEKTGSSRKVRLSKRGT